MSYTAPKYIRSCCQIHKIHINPNLTMCATRSWPYCTYLLKFCVEQVLARGVPPISYEFRMKTSEILFPGDPHQVHYMQAYNIYHPFKNYAKQSSLLQVTIRNASGPNKGCTTYATYIVTITKRLQNTQSYPWFGQYFLNSKSNSSEKLVLSDQPRDFTTQHRKWCRDLVVTR